MYDFPGDFSTQCYLFQMVSTILDVTRINLGLPPFPATVSTGIVICLLWDSYKPSFATATGSKGPYPTHTTFLGKAKGQPTWQHVRVSTPWRATARSPLRNIQWLEPILFTWSWALPKHCSKTKKSTCTSSQNTPFLHLHPNWIR